MIAIFFIYFYVRLWFHRYESFLSHAKKDYTWPFKCNKVRVDHNNLPKKWLDKQKDIFDPRGRPTVTAGSDHCFCTCRPFVRQSVLTFQNKTNLKRKKCSFLARLWVWPSGSLMTPVLSFIVLHRNEKSRLDCLDEPERPAKEPPAIKFFPLLLRLHNTHMNRELSWSPAQKMVWFFSLAGLWNIRGLY